MDSEARNPKSEIRNKSELPKFKRAAPAICFAGLILLFLLHNDFWLWNDARFVFGLPIGLLYHIVYCIAASVLMYSLVRYAWPESLEVNAAEEREL